jgi:organic hydroperoxide reductase OsmC/OhrA
MTGKTHTYTLAITWTGNTGQGTTSYRAYSRDHVYSASGKPDIPGSSDPAFRGQAYNPEDLLVASFAATPGTRRARKPASTWSPIATTP